jgi:hexosaminidase
MQLFIKRFTCLLIGFCFFICTGALAQNTDNNITLIPTPAKLKSNPGQFIWNDKTVISTNDMESSPVKFLLTTLSGSYHLHNKVTGSSNRTAAGLIVINNSDTDMPAEGYTLKVTPQKIILTGKNAGLFYGVQTLLQLLHESANGSYTLPCVEISDSPRFPYRGLMHGERS